MAETTPAEATDWGRLFFGTAAILLLIALVLYSIYLDPKVLLDRQDELWILLYGFLIGGAGVFGLDILRRIERARTNG